MNAGVIAKRCTKVANAWSRPMKELSEERVDIISIQRCSRWPRISLFAVLLVAVAVGCGGKRDDRDEIRATYGEPDNIEFSEGPFADYEVWTYYNFNGSGRDRIYRFQRNRNSCGASENWIIFSESDVTPGQRAVLSIPESRSGGSSPANPIKP